MSMNSSRSYIQRVNRLNTSKYSQYYMKPTTHLRSMLMAFASVALAFSASATLVTVSSTEVWNGTTNPHSADGVTISGSGSRVDPYVYSIPDGMTLTSSGLIRLSGDFSNLAETNSIVFQIPSGDLQIASGGYIDCGTPTRTIKAKFTIDMIGGGSVTGAGKIIGMDKTRSTASSINSRSLFIINALNVTLADIDLHTENVAAGPFVSTITASGAVNITGTINISDIEGAGGSDGGGIAIGGSSVTVNNINTLSLRPTGSSGAITLQALYYLYGTYDPSYAGNSYANQLVVKGAINTAGAAVNGGSITMQGVVVRLDPGSSIAKSSNGILTVAAGLDTLSLPASDLFMNISGTLVGPANTPVTPAYTVNWDGTPPSGSAPVFTSDPISGGSGVISNAYSGTLAGTATDADSDPLTYIKGNGPAWLTVAGNGALSGTPLVANNGTNSFQVAVTDGTRYDIATLKIVVTAPASAPVFTASPIVKAQANSGLEYGLKSQTLADSAYDANFDPLTFTKLSGPLWLTVAANGALSGTPTDGNLGPNTWSVSVSDGSLSSTGALQIIVIGPPSLATVSGVEVWNGSNNLHLAEGVTLAGSGTSTSPYVYTVPAGLRIVGGGSIRLSASVDYSIAGNSDTNHITIKFTGGGLQIDSGGWIDVGYGNRNVISRFLCDLGGGSINGAGKILGIDHARNAGDGVNVRSVTITNAASVSLANSDTHVENINSTAPDLRIYAANNVIVSGTVDTRYGLSSDAGNAGNCYIYAGFILVNNVDARAMNSSGRNNGAISLKALYPAGGYNPTLAAVAHGIPLTLNQPITADHLPDITADAFLQQRLREIGG